MTDQTIIDMERVPVLAITGFVIALLALVVAFVGIHRTNVVVLGTQTEVLALNKKIQLLDKPSPAAASQPPVEKAAK